MKTSIDENAQYKKKRDDQKIFQKYSAFIPRDKVLICFFLLLLLSFSVGTKLIFEITDQHKEKKIQKNISHPISANETAPLAAGVQSIAANRPHCMIWLIGLQFLGILATMFVYIRYFLKPLKEMTITARRIADGHLDETIPIRSRDEIGNVGKTINDIAVNLQETLLTVWNHIEHCSVAIDHIHDEISLQPASIISNETMKNLESLKQDMESMRTWVKEFDYYAVKLVERKVLTPERDRQKEGIQYRPQLGEGEYHD
jgi:methyl-accepting chemotaxis protein